MKTRVTVDYKILKQKSATNVKRSMATDRYIIPAPRTPKDETKPTYWVDVKGEEVMFQPSKDCLVQIGTNIFLMDVKAFLKLEVPEARPLKKVEKPKLLADKSSTK